MKPKEQFIPFRRRLAVAYGESEAAIAKQRKEVL